RGTIETIYGMIVTQAREPLFYRDLGVPDTVNGRFDLLLLHLWLVLRRLNSVPAGTGLSQALFDHFCEDLEDNLREMGVSGRKVDCIANSMPTKPCVRPSPMRRACVRCCRRMHRSRSRRRAAAVFTSQETFVRALARPVW